MYQAEEVLDLFGKIELHALGEACTMACEVAEKLVFNKAAKITLMQTSSVELDSWQPGRKDKKTKLLIHLDKAVKLVFMTDEYLSYFLIK